MSNERFTSDGKRKHFSSDERERFIEAVQAHERGEVHTFCMVTAYTGCRISEALELFYHETHWVCPRLHQPASV